MNDNKQGGGLRIDLEKVVNSLDYPFYVTDLDYKILLANGAAGKKRITKVDLDITELRRSQNILIRSEKLASLGRLVSWIAHEVNNPLMVISENAQLTLTYEALSAEVKSVLETIMDQCQKAKDVLPNVLNFARFSKGEVTEEDISQSIELVAGIVEKLFKSDNVKIKRNYPRLPRLVSVDKQHMQEVFMNLLINAKDAIPDGGTITITVSSKENFLRIDFEDTGSGMSEDTKKKIFEPFFTTKKNGTGLGLPICYGIIRAHNGELKFESQLNKGTTATVLLPLEKKVSERS